VKPEPIILRARFILPVSEPPIANGAIVISGERIAEIGPWRSVSKNFHGNVIDLGEMALLPGLINAHCHLDYTTMVGQFPVPGLFSDWLKLITTSKSQFSYSDYAESWLKGAKMLLRNGTTTVGDVESVPELLPEVVETTPLRVISFLEMTGIRSRRQPKSILQEAVKHVEELGTLGFFGGLSPHAPYSTLPELLCLSAKLARKRKWLLSIHVAESNQEFEMFTQGEGQMFDWLRRSERDMSDCGLGSPVQHLERCSALGRNLLAIHVNYLAKGDAALLARRQVSVVHCPRSHSYFRHDPFPYETLLKAGVNICLGTDSLASVYQRRHQSLELNLFEEMRTFASNEPSVSPRRILEMVSRNPARGLGSKGKLGELSKSAYADIIGVPFTGKSSEIHEAILHHDRHVAMSMIKGQWAIEPVTTANVTLSERRDAAASVELCA
jgi:aminodeoxyfutalosine deaminase